MELAPADARARLPLHTLLDPAPRWVRETITFFADGEALLQRQGGTLRSVPLLAPGALPGMWPPPTPPLMPPILPAESRVVARFVGRRAVLAPGVEWLEGRLVAEARSQPWRRLLVAGGAEAAMPLTEDLPLLPASHSLAEAAMALAEGRAPHARAAGPPVLPPEASAEAALRHAACHLLDVLLAEAPACRLEAGPRGVHQARVALRRLRSLVKLFRMGTDPAWAAWNQALGGLARSLGAARDWDVFLSGIVTGIEAALPGDRRLRGLRRAAAAERAAAYAALGEVLAGADYRRTVMEGLCLIERLQPGETPLGPVACGLLAKRWKRLKRAGHAMAALDTAELHEMRLDAKRLRYAAEPFGALWPGRHGKRFTRRLAALQEALGLANDAEVARTLAARLAGRGAGGFAIGTVTGFAAGRTEGSRLAALAAWDELARSRRFWEAS